MQIIFGILLTFTGAALGSLFQDHVVCRFNQSNQCYVAVGQRLHLQMPLEDGFDLKTTSLILRYRKNQSSPTPTPRLPRWQFVNDNKTMILTSAERNDSGTYTLNIFDVDGRSKGNSTLQVNIEAQVSSVKVSYNCLFSGVMKVTCSADGDNLHFSWTSDFKTLPQLENGTSTVTLEQHHQGNITCHVENHVSRHHDTAELHQCPGMLFQDHDVCRFNQRNPCYVVVGQRLHLQMPWEDGFDLKTTSLILTYRKTQSYPPTPRLPRWQFVNDNKTMILTSAERSDSGTYTLNIIDGDRRSKGSYTLQVNIEAQVSLVTVSYSCLSLGMRLNCSADGDNLSFSWTSDIDELPQLENGTSTVTMEQDHQGNITCHVENHVSYDHNTVELHQCTDLLFQDHVACRFTQRNPCYVAVGQRLQLQMPWDDGFDLKTDSLILRYRKTQSSPPTPRFPRWQFVNDNKTMILTSAERSDSGTYTLNIFDVDGRSKGSSTLQVNIEAQVSSVKVSYSCLFSEVRKVTCSADGDDLHFSWTSDFNTLPQLENGTSTVTLEQDHQGNITCHVENNVSRVHYTIELHQCPAQVSSVKVSYSCLFSEVRKVTCSADGDNLHFSWTSDFNTFPQLENGTSTVTLEQDRQGNITCHVENHISRDHDTAKLHQCPGSLFQDHVVCRFNQIKPCYVAVGQRLHLQMPLEDGFDLKTTSLILRYRKTQSSPPTPRLPRWQFVNDNKTMILTSAERSDSGTYTLNIIDVDGRSKGSYTLQVNIEGSLFQDHVVCTFNQIKPCYVAVGQRLHLQIPWEDGFDLKTTSLILRYRKTQRSPPTPHLPRWQFVNDNKTMILTSAERNDSGTYTLNIFDVDGRSKDSYTLQVNIEAQVSSVKVSYSCLSSGVMKVTCSADGDNLHFSWTSDFNTLPQLKNGTSTVTLEQDHQGNITCHVENHVSRDHDTAELHQCPGSLFKDHVVCRFNQINPCYVAVGQRLYLQMPLEDGFDLKFTSLMLRYRKTQSSPPTPHLPKWQFVNDSKTMILTSAERSDSGTYTLNIFDVDGRSKGSYTLQVNIEDKERM
ncbi:uncharacterized protein LOC113659133 isoform X2 [Tachysurus fulvidraco]|uniref:uncharacterized protein LOC113659133 isoform X2 n=1 Tax=Tachysurus fulvidraco TaxID=1234273 RepID=UPI001FF003FF|nr:uncharacterized protein LOC113659133 isoform X2 [Tachysurus fulvidraco]